LQRGFPLGRREAVLPSDWDLRLGLLPGVVMVRLPVEEGQGLRLVHPLHLVEGGQGRLSGLPKRVWAHRQVQGQELPAKCRGVPGLQDFEVLVPVLLERGPDPGRVRARDLMQEESREGLVRQHQV